MMWITWYAIGFVQIALNRWWKHASDLNSYFHAFLGWFIVSITIYSVFALVIDENESNKLGKKLSNHSIIGFTVFAACFVFTISGTSVFLIKKLLKWDTRSIILVRRMHRNSAFVIWVLGNVANYFGIRNYLEGQASFTTYDKNKNLPLISLLTGFGFALAFEALF